MRNWKIWTAFLTVFITGIIVGVVGVGLVLNHHFGNRGDVASFHANMRERMIRDIREDVRPNPDALPAIEAAIDATLQELRAIRREADPRVRAALSNGRDRIRAHLTPEQAERFDRMIEARRNGKFGFLRLPPPPPPRPE